MRRRRHRKMAAIGATLLVVLSSCADPASTTEPEAVAGEETGCADVIDAVVTAESDGTYRFDVTVRSADTGWDKYADLWEVRDGAGRVLGARVLAHPHVEEQPFTRSQSGIEIPVEVQSVRVVARDSVDGFCGVAYDVDVP